MRYLGNKTKLLHFIEKVIDKYNIEGTTFADLFAGTGCVGDFFKDKYKIISNDFLYYSYILNIAKLQNSTKPSFVKFRKKFGIDIYTWLNNLKFKPDNSFFFYNNYTPKGNRMFFSKENGIKIDGIRKKIEELYQNKFITENEYYFLIASMLESITKVSNTSGTFEAFLKFWDSRAEKNFEIIPLDINEVELADKNEIYNCDTNELIKKISGDIAYIDTPYTVTQYISAYHMFETLAKYDSPKITGIGGKRNRDNKNSLYAQRTKAKMIFEDLFRQLQFKHILISYSNQGLVPLDELCELAKKFAKNGIIKVEYFDYREYKNHRSSNKGNGKELSEVIIYFEKDLKINKSPINYSGSKDTLVPEIMKILPNNVNIFVDVMGGAFNVGANINAVQKVIYNEFNPYIYELINWILTTPKIELIKNIENRINYYKMKKADKKSYDRLKLEYNKSQNPLDLFVLHMYSFQNIIRFNNKHKFNTPVGVAGYSEDMKQRILDFKTKTITIETYNKDYTAFNWENFPKDTVFYFDPPYYITNASYNDGKRGMKGWNINNELELLSTLKRISSIGQKFILSNVIKHKDKEHTMLLDWVKENNYRIHDAGVSGFRYTKNEVLITNY